MVCSQKNGYKIFLPVSDEKYPLGVLMKNYKLTFFLFKLF